MHVIRLLPLVLALSGCTNELLNNQVEVDHSRQPQVELVQLDHLIRFTPDEAALVPDARDRLDRFLAHALADVPVGAAGVADAEIVLAPQGGRLELADMRSELIVAYLKRNPQAKRLPTFLAPLPTGVVNKNGLEDALLLTVNRYVVTPPSCPDWSIPNDQSWSNAHMGNWACADQYNLSQMVANPRDLLRGRKIGPQDGMRSALGMERYRVDEETELPERSSGLEIAQ